MSERRACQVMGVDRSSMRYSSRRASDAAVRLRIREFARERRGFGYGQNKIAPAMLNLCKDPIIKTSTLRGAHGNSIAP